jgi:DNA-binding MarR family transcriptional regulator
MIDGIERKIYRINFLANTIDALYHQAAKSLGVADSVLYILYMVHSNGASCPLSDLYKISAISKQTINSAIRKLEAEGDIYLKKHDGKSKIVCLTDKGRNYTRETAEKLLAAEGAAFADWSVEELDTYLHLIEKHVASLRQQFGRL